MKKPMMILVAAALTLAGCAGAPQKPDPLNRQELLAFAGFSLKVAVSQEDIDQIARHPPAGALARCLQQQTAFYLGRCGRLPLLLCR